MKAITLPKTDIHKGSLILINKAYPLVSQEVMKYRSLSQVSRQGANVLLEMKTAAVLTHVMEKLQCQEEIIPVSGYRTLQEQQRIYEDSLKANGSEFTEKYVALPGHSEHQTGLAIDLAFNQENIDFIRPEFPYEGVCNVFREKALQCGFVERYPRQKESITGIAHEPWHFRYVGYPHSLIMQENNLTLEEYVAFIKQYHEEGQNYVVKINRQEIEVFYVGAHDTLTRIDLPDDAIYQVSGNNVDGFIVTLWR